MSHEYNEAQLRTHVSRELKSALYTTLASLVKNSKTNKDEQMLNHFFNHYIHAITEIPSKFDYPFEKRE